MSAVNPVSRTQIGEPVQDRPDRGPRDDTAVVLIGFDGTPTSWDALWWGCGEARRLDGQVIAVYVSGLVTNAAAAAASVSGAVYDAAALRDTAVAYAADLRAALLQQTAGCEQVSLSFVHAWGEPANELLRISRAFQANVIVVGRSSKLRHRIAGSLGSRLISRPDSPLVVVVP
jgi:nucleotide-binding universal stress UspA family protein